MAATTVYNINYTRKTWKTWAKKQIPCWQKRLWCMAMWKKQMWYKKVQKLKSTFYRVKFKLNPFGKSILEIQPQGSIQVDTVEVCNNCKLSLHSIHVHQDLERREPIQDVISNIFVVVAKGEQLSSLTWLCKISKSTAIWWKYGKWLKGNRVSFCMRDKPYLCIMYTAMPVRNGTLTK